MEHRLKIHTKPMDDLISGVKNCEVRDCSDRDFNVGDTVMLTEVDVGHDSSPRALLRTISHIQTGYGLPDGLCVLSYEWPLRNWAVCVRDKILKPMENTNDLARQLLGLCKGHLKK